jgi:hypothetical protein
MLRSRARARVRDESPTCRTHGAACCRPGPAMPTLPANRRNEREALVRLIEGGRAHLSLADALRAFPAELAGERPPGAPHSAWQLVEHLRIAQHDIVAFGRDPSHESPPFPDGYWPASPQPPSARAFAASVRALLREVAELVAIARDPRLDLGAPIPGTATSWAGQLTLAAGHNVYHLGQLVLLRKLLEAPPPPRAPRTRPRQRAPARARAAR